MVERSVPHGYYLLAPSADRLLGSKIKLEEIDSIINYNLSDPERSPADDNTEPTIHRMDTQTPNRKS